MHKSVHDSYLQCLVESHHQHNLRFAFLDQVNIFRTVRDTCINSKGKTNKIIIHTHLRKTNKQTTSSVDHLIQLGGHFTLPGISKDENVMETQPVHTLPSLKSGGTEMIERSQIKTGITTIAMQGHTFNSNSSCKYLPKRQSVSCLHRLFHVKIQLGLWSQKLTYSLPGGGWKTSYLLTFWDGVVEGSTLCLCLLEGILTCASLS